MPGYIAIQPVGAKATGMPEPVLSGAGKRMYKEVNDLA
jgi:hypothetical protein